MRGPPWRGQGVRRGVASQAIIESASPAAEGFSHEALFYAGAKDFAERTVPFIREGLDGGEPVLVMVTEDKIALLRERLGADAERVAFTDMAEAGRNPGRIISHWSDFAGEYGAARGVGEPVWAGRRPDELVECHHHESLINTAFEARAGFRLLCPYDTESLAGQVVDEARRTHPLTLEYGERRPCPEYAHDRADSYHRAPLAPPDSDTLEFAVDERSLDSARRLLHQRAEDEGLSRDRADDLVMAVNEVATNSVLHGGGTGVVRFWRNARGLVCEVRDSGRIDQTNAGRVRPLDPSTGGYGLWLAHQLCDLVQVRSSRRGTIVRLQVRL